MPNMPEKIITPEKLPFYPAAILIDVDGTFFNSAHDFSPRTIELLRQYLSRTDLPKIVLCTGRHPATLIKTALPIFAELAPDSLHIVAGGAMLINAKNEILWQRVIAGATVQYICETVESLGGSFGFGNGDVFYSGQALLRERLSQLVEPSIDYRSSNEIERLEQWETPLIVINNINEAVAAFIESLSGQFSIKKMQSSRTGLPYYDLTLSGINKTTAAQKLAEIYGITPDKIIHIGDSANDMDMMTWAGLGVAMANATDDIKAVAKLVLPWNNDENGVAKFLEIILQK